MVAIRVEVELDATPADVWADIRRIVTHVEWMGDATALRFTSAQREGIGVSFDCHTRVGPLRLNDRMEITEWAEAEVMGVRHVGLVTGDGRFVLTALGADRTRFEWIETLTFPWWLGGRVGALIARPVLHRIWQRNLALLQARFS